MIDDGEFSAFGDDLESEPPHGWCGALPEYNVQTGLWTCPKCGGDLIPRDGKYGRFYGCSNFPKCKYTIGTKAIDTVGVVKPKESEKPKYGKLHPPELKPCPFCGGEGKYIIGAMEGRYTWHVTCTKCHATCGYKLDRSQYDAGKDWNTRYAVNHENSSGADMEPKREPVYPTFHSSPPDYDTNLDPICHEPEFEDVGAPHWGI